MLKIDRMFLIGFSIILITIASIIAFSSPLYWIVSPPQSNLNYVSFELPPNDSYYFKNYTSISPYIFHVHYLESGSIYSPKNVMFLNFTINGTNLKEFSNSKSGILSSANFTSFDIGMYFYLFTTNIYNEYELVQAQNKTYTITTTHTSASGNYYWNYRSKAPLMTSSEKSTMYYYEFLITVTTHYYSKTNGSYEGLLVQDYAPHIRYHTINHTQFVFDAIVHSDLPPVATFIYIRWGALNFAILVSGMVFIAIAIIVIILKNKMKVRD